MDVALKEYVEALIAAQEREANLRISYMEKAVEVAKVDVARRLSELNQLRSEVTSDRSQFLQINLYEAHVKETNVWRESVSDRLTRIETRSMTWTAAIGLFFLVVNLALAYYYRK